VTDRPNEPNDQESNDQGRPRPPVFVAMADEGNIPGHPSSKVLLFIVVAMLIGIGTLYLANRGDPAQPSDRPAPTATRQQ
jgi:hypothetical protein